MATFNNQATLSYNGVLLSSNIATGTLLEEMNITKQAVSPTYVTGDDVTYIVSIVNSGTTPYTGLTLTDNLGAYTIGGNTVYPLTYITGSIQYYVNGTLQTSPPVTPGPPMTITGISVPAGGNALIIYASSVNSSAPPSANGTVVNTVTLSGGNLPEPITATETITTVNEPNLTISKSVSPTIVTQNGQVTYTFVIQNTGNTAATAADNVIVNDTFDPVMNNITVTFNGATWVQNTNYTYDANTGVFATVAGQVTVPAATYVQNTETGAWSVTPGVSTLVITGTV